MDPFDTSLQSYPTATTSGHIYANVGGDDGERKIPFDTSGIANARPATNGLNAVVVVNFAVIKSVAA